MRDRDLALLLRAAQDEAEGADTQADFTRLVQGCVDHLGCAVGALLIPDKNIAICCTGEGVEPRAGTDVLSYAIAIEELTRIDSSVAITVAAHHSLGTLPIYLFGSEEQKRQWLPELASGRKLAAFSTASRPS